MALTPTEARQIRLRNDYATMENIRTPWLTWTVTSGTAPYAEQYEIELRLKTYIDAQANTRNLHTIRVTLGPDYPINAAPLIEMTNKPGPFHPNWWTSGRWCYGTWLVYESLGAHVVRMIQTLQYNEDITNAASPANSPARAWYLKNRDKGLFPCDRTPLPDPTGAARPEAKKKFVIK